MSYNWVQTFWNSLTNIDARNWIEMVLTIGASVVTAWATYQIMKSNSNQTKIAEQKRKDDLFKIRWEFYKEEILIELEKIYLEATKQYSSEEELYYQMEESEFLKNTGLSKKQHKEIINYNLILKTRWLFDDEIADWLKNLLLDGADENSKFVHVTFNIEDLGTFCVTEEFTKKFNKYLSLSEM